MCPQVAVQAGPSRRANHDCHSDKAQRNTGQLVDADVFVLGQQVRNDHRKQRRGGIEDRGQAAADAGLAPDDQAEWQQVVEQPHGQKRPPDPPLSRHVQPQQPYQRKQYQRRQPHAQHHQGERRQFLHGNTIEEERTTPQ
ncbi:hypothetical protein D9M71_718290 [compost metagenome]